MVPAKEAAESRLRTSQGNDHKIGRLEVTFWLMAGVLGFFHAWTDHHYLVNSDAMSYLDIAEAYLRKDWHAAINTYWSPLYSWLIALGLSIIKPSTYWKFATLHLLNFAIYLFTLGCFCFLIREVVRNNSQPTKSGGGELVKIPDWVLLALGYSLFIWSSLFLVTVRLESPDMLVAAFVYLATGILLRIRRQPTNWLLFCLLGIVLGVGFLAKSVMLPLTPVFLIASMFSTGTLKRSLPRVALAVVCFFLVAGPFVFAMSRSKGRLITGRSGKLNYLWSINRVTSANWQGEEPGFGTPEHPTRKIFDDPPAYEFGYPVAGTYPLWYDPTYWYEGSVSHFDFREQLRVSVSAVQAYYDIFNSWGLQYGLLVGIVALYFLSRRDWLLLYDLTQQWNLMIPAIAGLGLYALVNVQGRYVAAFIVLVWLGLFSAVRLRQTPDSHRLVKAIPIAVAAAIVFSIVASSSREAVFTVRQLITSEDPTAHEQWQVAEGLREKGIVSNDKVALIGDAYRAFWAHLLGIRIIAEVHREQVPSFWDADSTAKAGVINAFARTGVKAVVAEKPPPGTDMSGWQKIRNTDYYVYMLNQ
jgi:4-amino-4-deoxy-L-arabinose transferase-like glycosyltransferase